MSISRGRNQIFENVARGNGRSESRNGWKFDVVDARKEGRNLYRDNDLPRGIRFHFDEED